MEQNQYKNKILIVHDDKALLDMYVLAFEKGGFDVTPAFGAIDAIEKLRGGIVPDALLLDVTVPVMDSLDLLGIIRSERLVPDAKVFILSDEASPVSDDRGHTLGVTDYISKVSMTPALILKKVVDALGIVSPLPQ